LNIVLLLKTFIVPDVCFNKKLNEGHEINMDILKELKSPFSLYLPKH